MATCPKCGGDLLALTELGAIAVLACACGLRVAGLVEHGHLIPFHDTVPILALTGGAVHVLDTVG